MQTFKPEDLTLKNIIEDRARRQKDVTVFRYYDKKTEVCVSYGEFYRDICRFAAYFKQKGYHRRKIALIGDNSYFWIVSWFAVVFSDNIVIPLDREQVNDELVRLMIRCHTDMLIYADSFSDLAQQFVEKIRIGRTLSMNDVKDIVDDEQYDTDLHINIDENDVCAIIFTSGTTGSPKGVMLSSHNFATDAYSASMIIQVEGTSLLTLPLHHTFGFTVSVLSAFIDGCSICISRSLRNFSKDLKTFKPVNFAAVPLYIETMYKTIWRKAKEENKEEKLQKAIVWSRRLRKIGIDLRSILFKQIMEEFGGRLKNIICGGAYLDQKYIDAFKDFGVNIYNGYGITECSPIVAVNRMDKQVAGSVGYPLACGQVQIVDGEICVRGENVMLGYYEDDRATEESFTGNLFHTGDLGYLDDDGFLFINGRKKNLIILSNGKNVSAEELENKILDIENVLEVLVRGKNDTIEAEIYAEDQSGIDEKIRELNRQLPTYKRINRVSYRDTEFPKTTTQKIKRV